MRVSLKSSVKCADYSVSEMHGPVMHIYIPEIVHEMCNKWAEMHMPDMYICDTVSSMTCYVYCYIAMHYVYHISPFS